METVVNEMLKDRGYNEIIKENDGNLTALKNDTITYVYFCKEDKSGIKSYKNVLKFVNENQCNSVIFIYKSSITIFAKNEFEKMSNDNIQIELFSESQLEYNITKHILVPKHKLLSQEEKQNVLKSLRCELKSLPVITVNDPISRYYNFKRGQLIEITRKSPTNGVYILYRVVN